MLEQIDKDDEERKKIRRFIEDIRTEHNRIDSGKREAKRSYDGLIKTYNTQLEALQERCPHVRTEYHGDASGNNDSHYECLDCGKWDKRL